MPYWEVDDGAYREAYFDAVKNAEGSLGAELMGKISAPQAIAVSSEYREARAKVLIVGQETYHNYQPLAQTGPFACWGDQVGRFIAYDYGYDGSDRTPAGEFWRAFEEIRITLGLPSRRALAWTNASKVQRLVDDNGSFSVMSQTPLLQPSRPVAANKIIDWQSEMVRREFDFIAPDVVLFLTGSMAWFTRNTFPGYSEEEIERDGGTSSESHGPGYRPR